VVLDEAYIEYAEGNNFPDGVALLKRYSNLIVTRTFSKAWGLAALRVGYSVASPEISDLLNRVRAPFNVNSLGLAAAQAVLNDEDYLEAGRETNRQGMQQLDAGLSSLGLSYIPSSGNFLAVEMPLDATLVYQKLLQAGVIVRPVAVYGMPDYLRVSIGLAEENQAFLNALAKVLK
jgi:histidinol-phosphate aminotransferase